MSTHNERDQIEEMIYEGSPNSQVIERGKTTAYDHEPLLPGSQWRLINAKLPILGIPFSPHDSTTYKRMAFNPFTNEHKFLTETEIIETREKAKGE